MPRFAVGIPFGRAGTARGRRGPFDLAVGDALGWWRVEDIEGLHLIRLRAEMRLPGLAWLDLLVEADDRGRTLFRKRALFQPQRPLGGLYRAMVYPFHGLVFGGMQRNIALEAERLSVSAGDV